MKKTIGGAITISAISMCTMMTPAAATTACGAGKILAMAVDVPSSGDYAVIGVTDPTNVLLLLDYSMLPKASGGTYATWNGKSDWIAVSYKNGVAWEAFMQVVHAAHLTATPVNFLNTHTDNDCTNNTDMNSSITVCAPDSTAPCHTSNVSVR